MTGGLIGCGSLGCVAPLLLAIYCAVVLGDIGGPLFFPILMVLGAAVGVVVGAIAGAIVRAVRKRRIVIALKADAGHAPNQSNE